MSMSFSTSGLYNLLHSMNQTQQQQQMTMLRLSTGRRINTAADDPVGLIASSILNGELTSVQAASSNADRANAMMNVADGAVSEISSLVGDIQGLVQELASETGLTSDERQAKQVQIDAAIAAIDQMVATTSFNGQRLLDGTYAIQTTGVDASKITDVDVTSRPAAASLNMNVQVVSAAELGQVSFTGAGLGASAVTLKVTGNTGVVELSFAGSSTIAEMASAINANTGQTGVQAVASGGTLYFQSEEYGEDEFVKVEKISGTFALDGGTTEDYGKDAVVRVNGQNAGVDGNSVTFNVAGLAGSLKMAESFMTTAGGSEAFTVSGGGATFALTSSASTTYTVGLRDLGTSTLGDGTLGYLSDLRSGGAHNALDNPTEAAKIVNASMMQVARTRAQVGAFQSYTVESTQNMLTKAEESLSSAIGQIRDTDYALEVANMARLNTLQQAQTAMLGIVSQSSSHILGLFGAL